MAAARDPRPPSSAPAARVRAGADAHGGRVDSRGEPAGGVDSASAWVGEHGDWMAERTERLLGELAAELGAVLATMGEGAPLDVAREAHAAGWPVEISGFWVAACRRRGATWAEIADALGVSPPAARRRYGPWERRFTGATAAQVPSRIPDAAAGGASRQVVAVVPVGEMVVPAGEMVVPGGEMVVPGGEMVVPAGAAVGNLPALTTSFVGRHRDRAELPRLLERHRLVTVTGTAGVGKTRLAVEVARGFATAAWGGAWLVELGAIGDASRVPAAVAAALSLREQPGRTIADALVEHLRAHRLLLVLDNCEHVVGACAGLSRALLQACPGITILATSQEPLGIDGERVWPLDGLATGPTGSDGGGGEIAADAVVLFCERATARRGDFELTGEVAGDVAAICAHLDGNPLAIELAAARVGPLAPGELAALLEDRFRLLTAANGDAPARHRSLRAAFDWSHELLSGPQRALLRRLAVFAGSPTRDAVEEVCAGGAVPRSAVLDLLGALVAKSLVVADATGPQARYRLLETVRRYGMDRLGEAGEEASTCRRHARWCAALAERAEPELTARAQRGWLSRLDEEYADLVAAMFWTSTRQGEGETALRLAGSLTLYWRMRGSFTEGRTWLGACLGVGHGEPAGLRAKALWGAGFLSLMLSDFDAAQRQLGESLALYGELSDVKGRARCLLMLGNVCQHWPDAAEIPASLLGEAAGLARQAGDWWCFAHALALLAKTLADRGEPGPARQLVEECIEVARQSGDAQSLRIGLNVLGEMTMSQGEYDLAETLLAENLAVTEELGEEHGIASALASLGDLAAARGEFARARELLTEGLRRARKAGDPQTVGRTLCSLGDLSAAKGETVLAKAQFAEAASHAKRLGMTSATASLGLARATLAVGKPAAARPILRQVLAAARAQGDKLMEGDALAELAALCRAEGDLRRSATLYRQALVLRRSAGDLPGVAESLEDLAGVAAALGSGEHAARVFGAAQSLRQTHDLLRTPARQPGYDAYVAGLGAVLPAGQIEAAWAHGMTMTVDDAVRCACAGRGGSRALGGWASLTPSERKVAALAAEGLSNPEIATQLYLSRHTVAAHLTAAYPKLGIRSRKELDTAVVAGDI